MRGYPGCKDETCSHDMMNVVDQKKERRQYGFGPAVKMIMQYWDYMGYRYIHREVQSSLYRIPFAQEPKLLCISHNSVAPINPQRGQEGQHPRCIKNPLRPPQPQPPQHFVLPQMPETQSGPVCQALTRKLSLDTRKTNRTTSVGSPRVH